MRLVAHAGRDGDLRRRLASGQPALGFEHPQRHQHLLRRGVMLCLETTQEVEWTEPRHVRQLLQGKALGQVRSQVVDHPFETWRAFGRDRAGDSRLAAEFLQQRQQQAVECQRLVRLPQAVEQCVYASRAGDVVTHGIAELPTAFPGNGLDDVGVDVRHAIAPTAFGFGTPGVQHIGVHHHQRIRWRQVLAAAITEPLHAGFDRAQAIGFVGMRLEGVADDVRAVQLDPVAVCWPPELRHVLRIFKFFRDALHGAIMPWRCRWPCGRCHGAA